MKRLCELSNEDAKRHFLKGSSYFNGDMPNYISFEPLLADVATVLTDENYAQFKSKKPDNFPNVNYSFISRTSEKDHHLQKVSFTRQTSSDFPPSVLF